MFDLFTAFGLKIRPRLVASITNNKGTTFERRKRVSKEIDSVFPLAARTAYLKGGSVGLCKYIMDTEKCSLGAARARVCSIYNAITGEHHV